LTLLPQVKERHKALAEDKVAFFNRLERQKVGFTEPHFPHKLEIG